MSAQSGHVTLTLVESAAYTLAEIAARRHPILALRADRAAAILAAGEIIPDDIGYTCHGYEIDLNRVTCTCEDWSHNAPEIKGHKWCKHLLAAGMYDRLARTVAQPPAPQPAALPAPQLATAPATNVLVWAQSMAWRAFAMSYRH